VCKCVRGFSLNTPCICLSFSVCLKSSTACSSLSLSPSLSLSLSPCVSLSLDYPVLVCSSLFGGVALANKGLNWFPGLTSAQS
jgi:hypothetical protein